MHPNFSIYFNFVAELTSLAPQTPPGFGARGQHFSQFKQVRAFTCVCPLTVSPAEEIIDK